MVSENDVTVDLHIHSTASDGTLKPAEIVALALEKKLEAISITDHDSVEGVRELLRIGLPEIIGFVTGVEISASPTDLLASQGSVHILGYGIDIENPLLDQTLQKLRDARKNRNPKIIERLEKLSVRVDLQEVEKYSGDCQLGRPHIAKYLIHKGYVDSMDEAFDKYLSKGRPAYVDKFRITCKEAIELILQAGGVPVMAHPFLLQPKEGVDIENVVVELVSMGLRGIEVYYPEHPQRFTKKYAELAEKYDLVVTGGTDFHGAIKPEIELGAGPGNFSVPSEVYRNLKKSLEEHKAFGSDSRLDLLQNSIRYRFRRRELLEQALRHSSWVNEQAQEDMRDNERFEFLGDAALDLAISNLLMEIYPEMREGDLSRFRASLVNDAQLADLARNIRLGECLSLGKGEALTNGREKISILAAAFEALTAAVFLDGGFESAEKFVRYFFEDVIIESASPSAGHDFKSRLQEIVQTGQNGVPEYEIVEEGGPDHDKTFHVRIEVFDKSAVGVGKSKKAAEQEAARKILELLEKL